MTARAVATIGIRVDSGTRLGSGHLMRCLTLAAEVVRTGARAVFLCADHPGHLSDLVERDGHPLVRLPGAALPWREDAERTRAVLDGLGARWLIVDHYELGAAWERAARAPDCKLLAIDDLADRAHDCDVLLDQNYFGAETGARYAGLVPERCRTMLGPRYALLQRSYANVRSAVVSRPAQVRRVLVFFGGTDATNETCKALEALARPGLEHLAVDVVAGANHPASANIAALASKRPATLIYRNLPTLAGLMLRADLAVGAGGITTWERLCLGLPSVVVTVAPNQESPAAALAATGAIVHAGRAESLSAEDLAAIILRAIEEPRTLPALVDGWGAARVCAALLPPKAPALRLRRATAGDAGVLFEWRNEDCARAMSFDAGPVPWESHVRWLEEKLADTRAKLFIGEIDGLPIGQVRLDSQGEERVLSYGVDADFRGAGLGKALVEAAVRSTGRPAGNLRAHVKAQNEPSKKIFRALGWHETIAGNEHVYRLGDAPRP